jgi:hypothetical protein
LPNIRDKAETVFQVVTPFFQVLATAAKMPWALPPQNAISKAVLSAIAIGKLMGRSKKSALAPVRYSPFHKVPFLADLGVSASNKAVEMKRLDANERIARDELGRCQYRRALNQRFLIAHLPFVEA